MKRILIILMVVLLALAVYALRSRRFTISELESIVGVPTPVNRQTNSQIPGIDMSESGDISLEITGPAGGSVVTSPNITVRGKTTPRADVFINEKETVADASGNFSVPLVLDEGENIITITVNDAVGRAAEKELSITYNAPE